MMMEQTLYHIFDSHAHYDDAAFDEDRDRLLPVIHQSGVDRIINIGCSLHSWETSKRLAEQFDFLYFAAGIHPDGVDDLPADYLLQLERVLKHPKAVALGEIGLDYHYEGYDRAAQLRVFEEQLQLAKTLSLPVVIHSREATEDTMQLVRKYRPEGVMHCFSGSAETAAELVSLGMYVGFTGVLTFKNAKKALRAVEAVPIDRLLLETDCPYMAPVPFRGKRCDSSMLPNTLAVMASLKGLPVQEMADHTYENACRLFRIPD